MSLENTLVRANHTLAPIIISQNTGIPLHPLYRSLAPIIDNYSSHLPEGATAILMAPPHSIPSTQYIAAQYPTALTRHLLSMTPLPQVQPHHGVPSGTSTSSDGTLKARTEGTSRNDPSSNKADSDTGPSAFLGMPSVNMDVRKWNWPGYLTFGKGSGNKTRETIIEKDKSKASKGEADSHTARPREFEVDKNALDDAMSSDNASVSFPASASGHSSEADAEARVGTITVVSPGGSEEVMPPTFNNADDATPAVDVPSTSSHIRSPATIADDTSLAPSTSSLTMDAVYAVPEQPIPEFITTSVHLAATSDSRATRRRKIYYVVLGVCIDPSPSRDNP